MLIQTNQYCEGTVPGMPSIHNILTNSGHRFGHKSGLDETSGRISTTFLHGIAFDRLFCDFEE